MKCLVVKNFTDKYDSNIHYEEGKTYSFSEERINEIKSKELEINEKLIKAIKPKKK